MNLLRRFCALFRSRALDREMDAEMRAHLSRETEQNLARGLSPDEAVRAARRAFGGIDRIQETERDARGVRWIDDVVRDCRHGLRSLRRTPAFTATAVSTLALGVGACTAMFSLIHAVLLAPLPVAEPERLVWIQNNGPRGLLSEETLRVDALLAWREQNRSFEAIAAYNAWLDSARYTLTGYGDPQRLSGAAVSQNFLPVLGIAPLLGRNFSDEESVWNGRPAALLSHAFWQRQFGGDRAIAGRSITLNGQPTIVAGVLPPSFDFAAVFAPGKAVDFLVPYPLGAETARRGNTIFAIGRLKPGVTLDQARADLELINARLRAANPQWDEFGALVSTLDDRVRGSVRPAFLILAGAVACLLAIACVNLSNLLLARANTRRHELTVRAALGASRRRLIQQLLTESLLLSIAGGALGLLLASLGVPVLARLEAFSIPFLDTVAVDNRAVLFSVALSGLAALLCGALPAVQVWRRAPHATLQDVGHRGSAGRGAVLLRRTLVVSEIALACMLLVAAGLLLRSFAAVLRIDLGFLPEHAAVWRIDPTREFRSWDEKVSYFERLAETIAAVPGVDAAGLSDALPLGVGRNRDWAAGAKGVAYERGQFPFALTRIVDERYLQTMHIPLRAGRHFDRRDSESGERVLVVNETMARLLWPGRAAVGQTALVGGRRGIEHTVVGVVADVPRGLEEPPQPEMYLSLRQTADWDSVQLVVRSARPAESFIPEVRAALKSIDPLLATNEVVLLDRVLDGAIAPRRLITAILGGFSALALALAALGLYGVVAYSVTQRTREMGIRVAIGAQRRDLVRLVVGEGFKMAAAGVVIGIAGVFVTARVIESLLFDVAPTELGTVLATAGALLAVALLACWLPARRAARVDPLIALRAE